MNTIATAALVTIAFLLSVLVVGFCVWLVWPFLAVAWRDWRRRDESWSERLRRYGGTL